MKYIRNRIGRYKAAGIGGGAIVAALALATMTGVGGFSLFNSTQAKSATANTGTVVLGLVSGQGAGFSQTVSNMAPGDYIQREVVLTNTGTVGVSVTDIQAAVSGCTIASTSTACSSTPLMAGDTASPPMQVFGQTCGGTMSSTEINTSGEYTFACSGAWSTSFGVPTDVTATAVTAPSGSLGYIAYSGTPSTGSIAAATPMTLPTTTNAQGVTEELAPGKSVDVLLTSYLPTTADNAFQGNSVTLNYTFTVVQRTGEAK
jgi:hypothetical protein